jgi:hypothetical protein
MLYGSDCLTVFGLVLTHLKMPDQLLSRLRVLVLRESGELLGSHGTGEAELFSELAVPLALNGVVLLPIVLLSGGELFGVVGLRLACGEWFRDDQHGISPAE